MAGIDSYIEDSFRAYFFAELLNIEYEYDTYDDDADFDAEYDNWCEFERECRTGR